MICTDPVEVTKSRLLLVVPVIALALRLAGGDAAFAGYLLLALYALAGRAQVIHALALTWLFSMVSSGVATDTTAGPVVRYVVFAAGALSISMRALGGERGFSIGVPVLTTLLLGLLLAAHSLLFSAMPGVSLLKAVVWTVTSATLLAAWAGLSDEARDRLTYHLFGGLILLVLVSLPLLVMPLGYLRNATGFQGVLNQPQSFGSTVALLAAWSFGQLLDRAQPRWLQLLLVVLCLVLVVLSEARTAGLALVVAVIIAVFTATALSGQSLRRVLPGLLSRRVHLMLFLVAAVLLLAAPLLSVRVGQYIVKRGEVQSVVGAYQESRGYLMDGMWENIQRRPLQGIGFGIASLPEEMDVNRDPVLGLPVSAAIEKGVLPMMVVEEVGAFGALAVMLWIWMILRRSARGGGVAALAVVWTVFMLNLGEATLFSPGGMGLLPLVLIALAATGGRRAGRPAARA